MYKRERTAMGERARDELEEIDLALRDALGRLRRLPLEEMRIEASVATTRVAEASLWIRGLLSKYSVLTHRFRMEPMESHLFTEDRK